MTHHPATSLYDRLADQTASLVIRRYSTSFGMASRLLGAGIRQSVANIYALVRVADEIVDNPDVRQDSPEGLPVYRNILIENLKCDGAATAMRIRALPDSPMSNIVLRNVEITAKQGITITNAPDTRLSDVIVKHSGATTVVTSP